MVLTRSEEAKIIRARVQQRLAGDNCEIMEMGACGRMITRERSDGLQSATKEEALGVVSDGGAAKHVAFSVRIWPRRRIVLLH